MYCKQFIYLFHEYSSLLTRTHDGFVAEIGRAIVYTRAHNVYTIHTTQRLYTTRPTTSKTIN